MKDLTRKSPRKPDVPEEIQARWQRIVDLMAGVLALPAATIMKADLPQFEVFPPGATHGNHFRRGYRTILLETEDGPWRNPEWGARAKKEDSIDAESKAGIP